MKNSYSLESKEEYQRLEAQNKISSYNFISEIDLFDFDNKSTILDAGCGSGLVSRALLQKYADSNITAIDISTDRVQQAVKSSNESELNRINYLVKDIANN